MSAVDRVDLMGRDETTEALDDALRLLTEARGRRGDSQRLYEARVLIQAALTSHRGAVDREREILRELRISGSDLDGERLAAWIERRWPDFGGQS